MIRRKRFEDAKEQKPTPKPAVKEKTVKLPDIKLFGRWANVAEFTEPGLQKYITVMPVMIPKNYGSMSSQRFHKSRMHIVERLALHMMVPGHAGKRHRLTSGQLGGKCDRNLATIEKAFEIIESRTKTNPVQVLVKAIENAAPREEITSYQMGSVMARDAVIMSPQRRIDKTLRTMAQGVYKASFGKKKSAEEALAQELIAASNGSSDSHAFKEKERLEREAMGAR
ncbi:MAG: 30S ribosomal protein S7 [Candidatus Aenigmarchaeota archaeon]|nr:30S ribosomal protein S7 [Candidatus Aenigmarchaeota archaeon]